MFVSALEKKSDTTVLQPTLHPAHRTKSPRLVHFSRVT